MTGPIWVAGFGFREATSVESLQDAFVQALSHAGMTAQCVTALAAPHDKAEHPAFIDFADILSVPIYAIDAADIKATLTPTQSPVSLEKRQTGSVAEATALGFFKSPATIRVTRQISTDKSATCAIAEGAQGETK